MPPQSPQTILTKLPDYAVLPLHLPPLPQAKLQLPATANPPSPTHYLYIRPHVPSSSSATTPTSTETNALFIANIPIDSTPTHFRTLFASPHLGGARTSRITFSSAISGPGSKAKKTPSRIDPRRGKSRKRKRGADAAADGEDGDLATGLPELWDRDVLVGASSAVVEFVDRASRDVAWRGVRRLVRRAAAAAAAASSSKHEDGEGILPTWTSETVAFPSSSTAPIPTPTKNPPSLGSTRYLTHHRLRFPSKPHLQTIINSYTTAFSALETSRAAKTASLRSAPDADGFVTVTKGARTGPAREEEIKEMEERRRRKEEKQKERWGTGAFYRWQIRERRKEREREVVQGFRDVRGGLGNGGQGGDG